MAVVQGRALSTRLSGDSGECLADRYPTLPYPTIAYHSIRSCISLLDSKFCGFFSLLTLAERERERERERETTYRSQPGFYSTLEVALMLH